MFQFILNYKMREWYCKNFKFDMNIINCIWGAKNGYLNCLKYAHENGCPWDKYIYLSYCTNSNCIEYIEKKMK